MALKNLWLAKTKVLTKCFKARKYYTRCAKNILDAQVLGIETSCDDTGVAVVDSTGKIMGESLYSQSLIHLRFGGINPLFAHELHCSNIKKAVSEALDQSGMGMKDISAIAVTTKPGILVSLEVGVSYAKYLSQTYLKPVMPIHHMEAHALAPRMFYDIPFPYLVLLISGGHCLLSIVNDVNDFILLGESLDNAPGEVMDKAARRMKLRNIPEYSKMVGGRAIETAAKKAVVPGLFEFPTPLWKYRDCNFSFSGLKDSLERKLQHKETQHKVIGDGIIPEINELCASFQLAITEHLGQRTERAIKYCDNNKIFSDSNKNLVVSGGVATNDFIFKGIEVIGQKMGYNVFRPPHKLCTDNGIMIAWNGIEKLSRNCDITSNLSSIVVEPKATLGSDITKQVREANLPVKKTKLLKYLYNSYTCVYFHCLPCI